MTASHSASEIYAAASQGKFVVATIEEEDGYLMYFLPNDIPNYGAGFSRTVNVGGDYVDVLALSINEDKTVTTTLHTLPNVPEFDRTEDAGKVLTITANGLKWMTSIGGGNVPSAEGVEF